MIVYIIVIACIGFGLSLYGFLIEQKIKKDPQYKPACDISDRISCSKPFLSSYGKLLSVSNTIVGLFFYALLGVFAWCEYTMLIFYCSLIAVVVSIYLAYILYAKIKVFCLLCTAIYIVNLALLWASYTQL